ncbi:MAG: zf-TFIIB domain-containing protein [Ilumatobacteraceae bacterium]
MKCPIDTDVDLVMTDRQGIEIDYCPTCRGVWLDRGELDKIIERTAPPAAQVAPAPVQPMAPRHAPAGPVPADPSPRWDDRRRWDDDDDDDDRSRYSRDGYRKKKRSSLLGEIFDF